MYIDPSDQANEPCRRCFPVGTWGSVSYPDTTALDMQPIPNTRNKHIQKEINCSSSSFPSPRLNYQMHASVWMWIKIKKGSFLNQKLQYIVELKASVQHNCHKPVDIEVSIFNKLMLRTILY